MLELIFDGLILAALWLVAPVSTRSARAILLGVAALAFVVRVVFLALGRHA